MNTPITLNLHAIKRTKAFLALLAALGVLAIAPPASAEEKPDFTKEKTLYVVPYAHLDTQWRWTYVTTIDSFIKTTIDANLANFEKYPDNVFTFTGSSRFEMMKEYYPEGFEKVKKLVKEGRWRVGGSSVDENDANLPSPESVLRQILYGNHWFKREFGRESIGLYASGLFRLSCLPADDLRPCGIKRFFNPEADLGLPLRDPV